MTRVGTIQEAGPVLGAVVGLLKVAALTIGSMGLSEGFDRCRGSGHPIPKSLGTTVHAFLVKMPKGLSWSFCPARGFVIRVHCCMLGALPTKVRKRLGRCSRFVLTGVKRRNEQVATMRVMGLDPGLRALGWGVVEMSGPRLRHVANGVIRTSSGPLGVRLASLFEQLSDVWMQYVPDEAAVEQTFVNRDGAGTLKLGQARGIAMLVPSRAGIAVGEYAPNAVKKAVVGVGHADKGQVDHMVRMQLPGVDIEGRDAADALAIAICHAHVMQTKARVEIAP